MRKRVGITHDVKQRKEQWKSKYPDLRSWEIIKSNLTYEQAQEIENDYIAQGYEGAPGGEKKYGAVYSVYIFSH